MANRPDYWKRRFERQQALLLSRGEVTLGEMDRQYERALREITTEIDRWYARFADNNAITMTEARRLLSTRELAEFRWDVKEYIARGKENSVNGAWIKELENASARVHISRLEVLRLQIQDHAEVLYGNQVDGLERAARAIYTDGYYRTAFEIQSGLAVGWKLSLLNDDLVNRVIQSPWSPDGRDFRAKCWTAKEQLVNTLHNELTQMIIRGEAPDRAIRAVSQKMGVAKNAAGRLIMTESAYFASASQEKAFKDLGVDEYQIIATLDSKTSEICQSLDGKVLPMRDFQAGVTAPPFHPWCRTVTAPYFEDEDDPTTRIARGQDGKTYPVPGGMTYKDWYSQFVSKQR